MNDDDLDDFESINDDYFNLKESKEKVKHTDVRRRLEELLENKRLQTELDEYYEHFSSKGSYDNDEMQYE